MSIGKKKKRGQPRDKLLTIEKREVTREAVGGGLSEVDDGALRSVIVMMTTKCYIEVLNHCIAHLKLI